MVKAIKAPWLQFWAAGPGSPANLILNVTIVAGTGTKEAIRDVRKLCEAM